MSDSQAQQVRGTHVTRRAGRVRSAGRMQTVMRLSWLEAKRHFASPRMVVVVTLLLLFIAGGSWGLADPDNEISSQIQTETAYEVLFLVSLFVLFTATLGVVLLGFDGISRKRLTGELAIELAQPISRLDLAASHLFGLWLGAFIPTTIASLGGMILIEAQMGQYPSAVDAAYFLMATGLVLFWYASIQLLASSIAKDVGSAVTLGVGAWLLFTLVWLLVTAVLATLMGVDVTNLESDAYGRFSELVDLFSPNGVYQLLLENRLDGDAAPYLPSTVIWLSAIGWTLIPAGLFFSRFQRLKP